MADYPSPGSPHPKRTSLPGLVMRIYHLLRMFWFTELVLLLVFLYGLYAGWSTPRQWSDGYFIAALFQFLSAAISVNGGSSQTVVDATAVRYVNRGDMTDTLRHLYQDYQQKMNFGVRLFIGSLFTLLISGLILWT